MIANKTSSPTWRNVSARLSEFDRTALLILLRDLYASSKDNQTFLHTRFGLGEDALKPYKNTIQRWLWPDLFKKQDVSVAKAKKAIADYRKAIGRTEGMAELMVYYCECAVRFSSDVGLQDEGYFDALIRMFEQALKIALTMSPEVRPKLLIRLNALRQVSHDFGYGVGDDMDALMERYGGD